MSKRHKQLKDVRMRVWRAVEASLWPLTGKEIAQVLRLPYKPVVDALTALCNQGKVWRIGRKCTAMWTAQQPRAHIERAATHLNALFRSKA